MFDKLNRALFVLYFQSVDFYLFQIFDLFISLQSRVRNGTLLEE